jgi:hypothetical protein
LAQLKKIANELEKTLVEGFSNCFAGLRAHGWSFSRSASIKYFK